MPLIKERYCYKEILEVTGVDATGKKWIEVPIIDNVGERFQFASLMNSFGVNPSDFPKSFWPWWKPENKYNPNQLHGNTLTTEGMTVPGSVLWRPFEGLPASTDPKQFLDSSGWDYSGFIEVISKLLHSKSNSIIYVHCQLGADRTGAFHIGYLINNFCMNIEEAFKIASTSTSASAPNEDYRRLVEAYAAVHESVTSDTTMRS